MRTDSQKVLFSFNMLYDTDVGLIRLISESFRSDVFDKDVLDSDDITIRRLLVKRTNINPLSILTKDESALAYYNQFMNDMYNDILMRSEPTTISVILKACISFGGFDIYIQYNNELEHDILKKVYGDTCKLVKREQVNCAEIDIMYVKTYNDLIRFKNCNYVNIYMARYGFNVKLNERNQEIIDENIASTLFVTNKCSIVDIYSDVSLYDNKEE